MNLRIASASLAALALTAGAASALTITNKGTSEITVGVDEGNKESVQKIAGGKSLKLDVCKDACGLTGPWGFSQMGKSGETYVVEGTKIHLAK